MIQADIDILHSIRGRMRIRLRNGLQNPDGAISALTGRGITYFDYNDYTKTAVVCYEKIRVQKVLSKIAIYYATKNDLDYLHIKRGYMDADTLNPLQTVSFLAMLADVGMRVFLPGTKISEITSVCALLSTVGAIVAQGAEHTKDNEKQINYITSMMKSLLGKNSTLTTATAWFSEFGKHLYWNDERDTMLKIDKRYHEETKSTQYDVKQVSINEPDAKKHVATELLGTYIVNRFKL